MRNIIRSIKVTFLAIALSLPALTSSAQAIQEVQNSFNVYKQTALQEKVFVHTDKTTYLPGEIMWLKVFCVDGNDHKPLNLSKVVYVEVLDNNQGPIAQAKIAMKNGIGDGSLYIPVTVNNGNYKFRAYTSWMKNFSADYYFEKVITIINPLKSPDNTAKETAAANSIQFFPEGGNLVGGIASKVAFKAVDKNGRGITVRGAVVDQHNDTVAHFKSLKFGMGSFSFTPAAGSNYKAVVWINGNQQTQNLPEINSQGYVMSIADNGAQLNVTVRGTDGNVFMFAHTRQELKAAESATISNGIVKFTLNKSSLGDGISSITIFNGAKQPVCERLYFKRPAQKLFITAGT
ncbi:MAG TPA: MG2 domain-containing protein, partial [Mucilaginibacter sp.]|nr:MG2 domain-containing protein [Mucilaginibacter sp.]